MNQRKNLDFLKDIQASIRLIDNYIEGISKEEFFKNQEKKKRIRQQRNNGQNSRKDNF